MELELNLGFTQRNPNYKECRTDNAVYFVGGPLSQWSNHGFTAPLGGKELKFANAEQYMMAAKADMFGDTATLAKIMQVSNPKAVKALGREVVGFDKDIWDANNMEAVYQGNLAKFSQNPELKKYLLDTGDMLLVEGAWYDAVWGVKLAFDDPAILDQKNWKGENRLGQVLTRVRETLRKESPKG